MQGLYSNLVSPVQNVSCMVLVWLSLYHPHPYTYLNRCYVSMRLPDLLSNFNAENQKQTEARATVLGQVVAKLVETNK